MKIVKCKILLSPSRSGPSLTVCITLQLPEEVSGFHIKFAGPSALNRSSLHHMPIGIISTQNLN